VGSRNQGSPEGRRDAAVGDGVSRMWGRRKRRRRVRRAGCALVHTAPCAVGVRA